MVHKVVGLFLMGSCLFQPNLYSQLVWKERAPLPLPRSGYMAGVVGHKYVVAGGSYWVDDNKRWTADVEVFDPRRDVWRKSVPMPVPRSDAAAVSYKNGLYIFGGGADGKIRRDVLVFREGEWKPVPSAELPDPRLHSVAVVCENKIYLAGGMSKAGNYKSLSNAMWEWNPNSPEKGWKVLASLPGPGLISQAMAAIGGKIYVLGGAQTGGPNVLNVNTAYEFNPKAGKWVQLPPLPISRRCWWGLGLDNRILLLGGYTTAYERTVFEYTPTTDAFTRLGDLPYGVCDAKFLQLGDTLVGTGGEIAPRARGRRTIQSRLPVFESLSAHR